jgi:membrane-associated phospholipid phosphatase
VPTAPAAAPSRTAPAALVLPSVSELFGGAVSDFRRLPSRGTATWLSLGVAAALFAHASDARVSGSLGGNRYQGTFRAGTLIGGMPVQLGGALATYTVGRITHNPRAASLGADLFQAQILAQTMTHGIKMAARRTRPDGSTLSFPSGHTSSAFASATVLQRHFGWKAGVPAYALATYVATSRMEEKRHFLSDVTFGAVLGIVAGRTVTVGRGDARFAVAPVATSGGGAVAFTWVGHK